MSLCKEEHTAAVWCCSLWHEKRQSESPEPRLADVHAGSLDAHCSRGAATEGEFCRALWKRHEWKKPAPLQGVVHMERETKSFREISSECCSDKSQIFFLKPYPQHQFSPSASISFSASSPVELFLCTNRKHHCCCGRGQWQCVYFYVAGIGITYG